MGLIYLEKGSEKERVLYDKKERTVSFVGVNKMRSCSKFGIGILFPERDTLYFWGLLKTDDAPHSVIATWRGWKLLEETWYIGDTTLCACLASGHHTITEHDQVYVDTLWLQFAGHFLERREEILTSLPSVEELTTMTDTLTRSGITFSSREVTREYDRLGMRAPAHIVRMSHHEPAESFGEYVGKLFYTLFH